jgi:hypothetical protein
MTNQLQDDGHQISDDNWAGTVLLLVIAALALVGEGIREATSGGGIVLDILGPAYLPALLAILFAARAAWTIERGGAFPVLAIGTAIAAFGIATLHHGIDPAWIGRLVVAIGLGIDGWAIATFVLARVGPPSSVTMIRLWDIALVLGYAVVSWSPLGTLHLAVLAILADRVAPRLGTTLERRRQPPVATSPPPSPDPPLTPPPRDSGPRWTLEQQRIIAGICEFIINTQGDKWPNPKIKEVIDAPAYTTYVLEKPDTADAGKFMREVDNLAIKLGVSEQGLDIIVSGKRQGLLIQISKPKDQRAILWFDEFVAKHGPPPPTQPYRVVIGEDSFGDPVYADITGNDPHLLIAGTTGSGKTIMMHSILAQLLWNCSPKDLQIAVIDPKMVSGALYAQIGIPHLWAPVVTELDKIPDILRKVEDEMMRRYRLLADAGYTNYRAYNAANPDSKLPVLIFLIDEVASLTGDATVLASFEKHVGNIAMKGRGAGVLLILGIQRPSQRNLSENVRGMLNQRIVLKTAGLNESTLALGAPKDDPAASRLGGNGDGYYVLAGERTRFTGAFLPEEEDPRRPGLTVTERMRAVVAKWGARPEPSPSELEPSTRLAAAHTAEVTDREWLIITALRYLFADADDPYEYRRVTAATILPLVGRAAEAYGADGLPVTTTEIEAALARFWPDGSQKREWDVCRVMIEPSKYAPGLVGQYATQPNDPPPDRGPSIEAVVAKARRDP